MKFLVPSPTWIHVNWLMSRVQPEHRVTYAEAKSRCLRYLATRDRRELTKASGLGMVIWPDSTLRSQGLGGAASRILKRMEAEGLVRWDRTTEDWGWRITSAGRRLAQS